MNSRLRFSGRRSLPATFAAGLLAVFAAISSGLGQGLPVSETLDRVTGRPGVLRNGSVFTPSGGGRTGQAGDHAIDFGASGSGPVYVADAGFFNVAAAADEFTVSLWAKKYDIAAGSVFWANSPSSNNGQRGAQAHLPWSNNRIYFDTAGCCAASQRIDESIEVYGGYTGEIGWWTENWNHFVFLKKKELKQIWINGELFHEGNEAAPLPADFTDLFLGSDGSGAGLFRGLLDDFAVYGTALTEAQIGQLGGGASPSSLPSSAGLLAYWDFNDAPAAGQFLRVTPAPGATAAVPDLVEVVVLRAAVPWTPANVSLRVDGAPVTPVVTTSGELTTVRYVPEPVFAPQTSYTVSLTYPGPGGSPATAEWSFTVGLYLRDRVASRVGVLQGGATFSPAGGGRSGQPGDHAIHFPTSPAGSALVRDASFLNGPAANDTLTFAFWQRLETVRNASAFWALSPSSPSSQRGFQAHVPWGDQTIYFDSSGCCAGDVTRISQNVNADTQPGFDGPAWWRAWRHFVFVKRGSEKEIWIDGQLFHSGGGDPLPTDFTSLVLGGGPNVTDNRMAGLLDDFAIYGTALTPAQIQALAGGAAPGSLEAGAGLLAHWDFNDMPPEGVFAGFIPAPGSTAARPDLVQVTHVQGSAAWNLAQVSLALDGATVPATVEGAGGIVTVRHIPSPLPAPGAARTAVLTYPGPDGQPRTRSWSFTVGTYTRDAVAGRLGLLTGPARFTPDGEGRTGQAGDRAMDLGAANAGQSVHVLDGSFVNAAAASDELAFAAWQKLRTVANSSLFWGRSPSSSGGGRGWSIHAPWSNSILYFDTAGCCSGELHRISAPITDFPAYSGEPSWWQEWRHFVVQKKGDTKQIWIDGQLFLEGFNTSPLPTDFTEIWFGLNPADNAAMLGWLDDAAIFSKALSEQDIGRLAAGTKPDALGAGAGLLAYWPFNDAPAPPAARPTLGVSRSGGNVTITSDPQPLPAGFVIQTAPAVNGPWTTVAGQNTPYTVAAGTGVLFLRALQP